MCHNVLLFLTRMKRFEGFEVRNRYSRLKTINLSWDYCFNQQCISFSMPIVLTVTAAAIFISMVIWIIKYMQGRQSASSHYQWTMNNDQRHQLIPTLTTHDCDQNHSYTQTTTSRQMMQIDAIHKQTECPSAHIPTTTHYASRGGWNLAYCGLTAAVDDDDDVIVVVAAVIIS